jgi:hypothetical protein
MTNPKPRENQPVAYSGKPSNQPKAGRTTYLGACIEVLRTIGHALLNQLCVILRNPQVQTNASFS